MVSLPKTKRGVDSLRNSEGLLLVQRYFLVELTLVYAQGRLVRELLSTVRKQKRKLKLLHLHRNVSVTNTHRTRV